MNTDGVSISFSSLQLEAINSAATGKLKIIAGAGSGKTEVLTNRIINLYVNQKVLPSRIVGITYTKKAASEIKQRIFQRTNNNFPRDLIINTFHGFLTQLIMKDPFVIELTGDEKFITEFDQKLILEKIKEKCEEYFWDLFENIDSDISIKILDELPCLFQEMRRYILKPSDITTFLKKALNTRKLAYCQLEMFITDILYKFYALYRNYLQSNNLIDFDEILIKAKEYLCSEYIDKTSFLPDIFLIDEFQDNNFEQMEIVQSFLDRSSNSHITVVGDFRQSIFRFQGADVNVFMQFKPHKEIILSENYRSIAEIVDLATHVFSISNLVKCESIKNKYLFQTSVKGNSIREFPIALILHQSINSDQNQYLKHDAEIIAKVIKKLVNESLILAGKKRPIKYSDIAIIVPSVKYLPSVYEDMLIKYEIPYFVTGSLGFYGRSEIAEIIAFFKILVEPKDDISLLKILTGPIFGLKDSELVEIIYQDLLEDENNNIIINKNDENIIQNVNLNAINQSKIESTPLWIKLEKFYKKLSTGKQKRPKLTELLKLSTSGETTYNLKFDGNLNSVGCYNVLANSSNFTNYVDTNQIVNQIDYEKLYQKIERFINFYKRLQFKSLTSGVVDLLYFIIEDGGYKEYIASIKNKIRRMQYEANLLKLFSIARNFEKSGVFNSLRDFLSWYEEIQNYDIDDEEAEISFPDSDAVNLLTIHKAKGLEFPLVILPNVSRKKFKENRIVRFNKEFGLVTKYDDLCFQNKNVAWEKYYEKEREEHDEEEIRKLYVAITRASELLIITGIKSDTNKHHDSQSQFSTKQNVFLDLIQTWISNKTNEKYGAIYNCNEIDLLCQRWLEKNEQILSLLANQQFLQNLPNTQSSNECLIQQQTYAQNKAEENKSKISDYIEIISKIYKYYYDYSDNSNQKNLKFIDISKLSIYDLVVFEECPRKFFLHKNKIQILNESCHEVTGLEKESYKDNFNYLPETFSLAVGSLFHKTLRVAYDSNIDFSEEDRILALVSEIANYMNEYRNDDVITYVKNLISSFLKSELAKIKPMYVEKEVNFLLQLNLNEEVNLSYTNNKVYIKGYIDRIDKIGDLIRIIDYKTSFNITSMNMYKSQLSFYEAAIKHIFIYDRELHPKNNIQIESYIASIDPKIVQLYKINTSTDDFVNWAKDITKRIISEVSWAKTSNKEICNDCVYRVLCYK